MAETDDSQLQDEVSIAFMAAPGVDKAIRRATAVRHITPPSIKMRSWPNELGEKPTDSIGRSVELRIGDRADVFGIIAVGDDDALILDHRFGDFEW